jgi:hypothetical protein
MHSFHHSRGRVLFEIFCALTIAASCVVAWQQSYISAFLAIGGVAALYAMVHATDLRRPREAVAAVGPVIEPHAEEQGDLLAYEPPVVALVVEEEPAAEPAPRPKRKSRKKPAVAEVAVEVPDPEPETVEAVEADEAAPEPVEIEASPDPVEIEEEYHAPVTPLFEPQPIVRQQRAVFGRRHTLR